MARQFLNQLTQGPVKGQVSHLTNPTTVSAQIDLASVATIYAGAAVKLVSRTAKTIVVDLCAASDAVFGYVVYGPKKNTHTAGESIEVLLPNSVLYVEAFDAINRGNQIEFYPTGALVKKARGTNPISGVAMDNAAAGELLRIIIRTSSEYSSSSSCSSSKSSSSSSSSSSCKSSSSSSSSSSSCKSSSSSSSSSCKSSSSSSSNSSSSSSSSNSSSSSSSSLSSSSSSSSSLSSSSSSLSSSSRSSSSSSLSSSSSSSYSLAEGWFSVTAAMIDSSCGDDGGPETLVAAIGGTNSWKHSVNETHWFIIDLGSTKKVEQVRGRSGSDASWDPTNVNIYVSDDKGNFGVAVVSGITNWQDTGIWQEHALASPKNGRYIKVEITTTEEENHKLEFGGPAAGYFKIFDAYVSLA